jgi:hypothetical protein
MAAAWAEDRFENRKPGANTYTLVMRVRLVLVGVRVPVAGITGVVVWEAIMARLPALTDEAVVCYLSFDEVI